MGAKLPRKSGECAVSAHSSPAKKGNARKWTKSNAGFSDLIVGAATVAAGGCLAWEKETKPGGVAPLQFVRRALMPVEHLDSFGAEASIHVVIKVVEIHHRTIQNERQLRHISVVDDQV